MYKPPRHLLRMLGPPASNILVGPPPDAKLHDASCVLNDCRRHAMRRSPRDQLVRCPFLTQLNAPEDDHLPLIGALISNLAKGGALSSVIGPNQNDHSVLVQRDSRSVVVGQRLEPELQRHFDSSMLWKV